jgi:hypothetical protein
MAVPKVTFGIIVFNGEPFTRYCLRSIYPFAHEIIVVEGAGPGAASLATPKGHSSDGTLETLYSFQSNEDPENKIQIITREGIWSEKDEQSQAYALRATGDYLWQVDIDEFYLSEDMHTVLSLLAKTPSITAVSFPMKTFWGGFDYLCDGPYLHRGWCADGIHRVFKWGQGYRYVSHRPVKVVDSENRDLHTLHWVTGTQMEQRGIYMYHYSLVFPKQVTEKSSYYGNAGFFDPSKTQDWVQNVYFDLRRPYRVHNVFSDPSWLERFSGKHPEPIGVLRKDLAEGRWSIPLRATDDIERILQSPMYRLGSLGLRIWGPLQKKLSPWRWRLTQLIRDPSGSYQRARRRAGDWLRGRI